MPLCSSSPQWRQNVAAARQELLHTCARGIRAADGALVAQLHGILKMNEELCPAYGGLRQIAHHAGVRFFSEVVELPEDELDSSLEAIHERAHMRTQAVTAVLSSIKTATRNSYDSTARIYYVNQSLFRSRLESPPTVLNRRCSRLSERRAQTTGRTRNCINSNGNCSALAWKKRPKPDRSGESAGQPIKRKLAWATSHPLLVFRICLTRWLKRIESALNRTK